MRRATSTILFVFGGWMLTSELTMAFFDIAPGLADNFLVIGLIGVIAAVPLLLGTWVSPGRRWRELGLTLLIAAGITVFMLATLLVVLTDPVFMRYAPPVPDIQVVPVVGALNMVLIGGAGLLLYREPKRA